MVDWVTTTNPAARTLAPLPEDDHQRLRRAVRLAGDKAVMSLAVGCAVAVRQLRDTYPSPTTVLVAAAPLSLSANAFIRLATFGRALLTSYKSQPQVHAATVRWVSDLLCGWMDRDYLPNVPEVVPEVFAAVADDLYDHRPDITKTGAAVHWSCVAAPSLQPAGNSAHHGRTFYPYLVGRSSYYSPELFCTPDEPEPVAAAVEPELVAQKPVEPKPVEPKPAGQDGPRARRPVPTRTVPPVAPPATGMVPARAEPTRPTLMPMFLEPGTP